MVRAEDGAPWSDEQTRLVRTMFDNLPAMVAYWDRDLRNVVANAAYLEWFGRDPAEMAGIHIREVLGEVVFAKNLPYMQAALAGEEQLFQRTLVDTLGRTRHTQASYVPDVVGDEVRGFFVLVTDVTPRVEAQRDLDEAQALARVGSWTYRVAERELKFSAEMFRLIGKDPETFIPSIEGYLDVVHPDDLEYARAIAADIEAGTEYEARYRILVGEEVRHVRSRALRVSDAAGDLVMLRATVQDETELQRQAAELEQANRLLADMVGMVGHDLRQPLSVILGYLEQALEDWGDHPTEVVHGMVTTGFAAARRLDRLLNNILAMINVDTGTLAVRAEVADLATAVTDVVADLGSPGQVEVTASAPVCVDRFHLRQVLGNLLANAERYGAPPVTVTIDADDVEASVTVRDSGEGVPAEFVDHLFERFSRATSGVAIQNTGTGFGLYIVRELVQANGGRVAHHPNEPRGSCFTLTFPVEPESARRRAADGR